MEPSRGTFPVRVRACRADIAKGMWEQLSSTSRPGGPLGPRWLVHVPRGPRDLGRAPGWGLGAYPVRGQEPRAARCRPRRGAEAVSEPQAHVGEKAVARCPSCQASTRLLDVRGPGGQLCASTGRKHRDTLRRHFQPRAQRAQNGRVRVSGCTNTRAGGVGGPGRLRVCVHMPPSHRRA